MRAQTCIYGSRGGAGGTKHVPWNPLQETLSEALNPSATVILNRSNWQNISGATSSAYTATADDVGNYLRAVATYEDRRGSNKRASASITGRIEDVADRPTTNRVPEFGEAQTTRGVGAGTAVERSVGAPVRATDPDQGDTLTYSLSGIDADAFTIDPATGQIRTSAVLDPHVKDTYTATVDVHDGFDSGYNPDDSVDNSIDVTITVTESRRSTGGGGGIAPPPVVPQAELDRDPADIDFVGEWELFTVPGSGVENVGIRLNTTGSVGALTYSLDEVLPEVADACPADDEEEETPLIFTVTLDQGFALAGCREGEVGRAAQSGG